MIRKRMILTGMSSLLSLVLLCGCQGSAGTSSGSNEGSSVKEAAKETAEEAAAD